MRVFWHRPGSHWQARDIPGKGNELSLRRKTREGVAPDGGSAPSGGESKRIWQTDACCLHTGRDCLLARAVGSGRERPMRAPGTVFGARKEEIRTVNKYWTRGGLRTGDSVCAAENGRLKQEKMARKSPAAERRAVVVVGVVLLLVVPWMRSCESGDRCRCGYAAGCRRSGDAARPTRKRRRRSGTT